MPQPSESIRLQDLAAKYLATLPPAAQQQQQPEVSRFVRWFGTGRSVVDLRGHDIENYAENIAGNISDLPQRLETVRAFLAFARKEKYTPSNLAVHVRLRKASMAGTAGNAVTEVPEQVHLTAEGRVALQKELEELKAERPRVTADIARAMSDKDFRENAPLDAAKDRQAHVEARIRELETVLHRALIIGQDTTVDGEAAGIGSTVVLRNLKSDAETRFTLVSPNEVDPAQGKISVESPVGRALLQRRPGEEVEVAAPRGTLHFRIERVEA